MKGDMVRDGPCKAYGDCGVDEDVPAPTPNGD